MLYHVTCLCITLGTVACKMTFVFIAISYLFDIELLLLLLLLLFLFDLIGLAPDNYLK